MSNFIDMEMDFDLDNGCVQESYNAASSSYTDLFESKFTSFDPDAIVGGNNKLKSGMFDMEIEDSDLRIGYKNDTPATNPKPGRWF